MPGNFSRVNPLGWAIYELLSSSQMNQLDINMTLAVNGQGSTHTPLEDIVLNGPFGLQLAESQLKYETDRVVPRRQPLDGAVFDATEWEWAPGVLFFPRQLTGGVDQWLRLSLSNLPHGGKLTSVTVSWDGPGPSPTQHANDPVVGPGPPPFDLVTPELEVYYATQVGGTVLIGSQTDTVVARASYEQSHTITASCADHVIDLVNNAYYIRFRGEYDPDPPNGDFLPGGLLEAVETSCKVSAQSEY